MQDAINGGELSINLFNKLGVQIKDNNGNLKSFDKLLLELSDAFKRMTNESEAVAIALDLFGKSGKDLIPILKGGSDALREQMEQAKKYGAVLDEATVRALDRVGDEMTRIKASLTVLTSKVTAEMMPIIEGALKLLNNIIQNQTALNMLLSSAKGLLIGIIALNIITFLTNVKMAVVALSAEIGVIVASLSMLIKAIELGVNAMKANNEVMQKNKETVQSLAQSYDNLSSIIQYIQSGGDVENLFDRMNMSAQGVRNTLKDLNNILLDPNKGFEKYLQNNKLSK